MYRPEGRRTTILSLFFPDVWDRKIRRGRIREFRKYDPDSPGFAIALPTFMEAAFWENGRHLKSIEGEYMRILVTGGAGYIGSHVVKTLGRRGP